MTPPLVSVITAAYNAARYLPDCLHSVRVQSFSAWEHVLVDDGSSDDSSLLIAAAARQDARVRPVLLPQNRGTPTARNAGLEAAQGRYLAFLDADDTWLVPKLERQLQFMREHGAAISYTSFCVTANDGSRCSPPVDVPEQLDYPHLLKRSAIAFSTAMVDTELTGPVRFPAIVRDDFAMWLSLLRRGLTAHGLNEDLMRYRVTPGSLSRNKIRAARRVWRVYREAEGLSALRSAWCLGHYGWHALRKRRRVWF